MNDDQQFRSLDDLTKLDKARILAETGRIAWRDLQRFFAGGLALAVDPALDLVDVASAMARDDRAAVESWLQSGDLGQVSDAQALAWYEADAEVWSVVIKPWVLVQASRDDSR